MSTIVYSFENVILTINGVQISSFFDGNDAITVTPSVDVTTKTVGADGTVIFNQTADTSAEVEVKLLQSSASNAFFTAWLALQKESGLLGYSFSLKSLDGANSITAPNVVLSGRPEQQLGVETEAFTWKLMLDKAQFDYIGDF